MFKIEWYVPYEGTSCEWVKTLEDVKSWVKENSHKTYCSYDDLTILEVAREINVYSLMRES
jgi:hypothetical protein